jgi:hypothetical protein
VRDLASQGGVAPYFRQRLSRQRSFPSLIASPVPPFSDNGISLVIEPKASHPPGTSDAPIPNEADRAKLMAINDADLQTYAAERNVEWDAKASKKTMVERVLKATAKK